MLISLQFHVCPIMKMPIILGPVCLLPTVPPLLTQESFVCRVGFPQRPCHFSIQAPVHSLEITRCSLPCCLLRGEANAQALGCAPPGELMVRRKLSSRVWNGKFPPASTPSCSHLHVSLTSPHTTSKCLPPSQAGAASLYCN